jgi:hypothetical protein
MDNHISEQKTAEKAEPKRVLRTLVWKTLLKHQQSTTFHSRKAANGVPIAGRSRSAQMQTVLPHARMRISRDLQRVVEIVEKPAKRASKPVRIEHHSN